MECLGGREWSRIESENNVNITALELSLARPLPEDQGSCDRRGGGSYVIVVVWLREDSAMIG